MGASFSTTNAIWVQTEKPSYFEGEVVNGTIYLNCIKPFQCTGLHIEIHGEERTSWVTTHTHSDGKGNTRTEHHHHRGHSEFFRQRVLVYNFGGHVPEGQYAFPFQFQLPPGMPGCFDASVRGRGARAEKDHAYIQYRVTSECDVAGMFNSNMKHTQYLVVQQRLMQPIIQVRLEATENVTACCCFGKGQAHLSAHLDKSAYVPGENIGILAEITNQSEEAFGNVRVELRRRMTIRANGGETQTTDVRVATSGYGGVGKGEVRVGANALPLPLGLPTDISPSTQGRLIHCEYYVDVVFVASSAIVRNLHVKVPVSIYAPPPPAVEFMTQLPPGWHGQQMGMTQVQLPAAAGSPPGPPLAGSPPGPPQQYGGAAAAPSPYGGAPPTATTPLLAGGDGGYGGVPQQPGYQQPYGAPPPSAPYSGQYGAPVVQQQPQ